MTPSPRIAHFFNSWTYAGAAIAAMRIGESLHDAGCDVSFWHKDGQPREKIKAWNGGPLHYAKPNRWLHAWNQWRHQREITATKTKAQAFSLPWHSEKPKFYPERYGNGVLHLHWLGGDFFDYESFFSSIPDNHPIVWTLHDLNPITGGCHYAGACRNFEKSCGNCPQLVQPATNDLTRRAMAVKLRILKGKNLHFVAPSHWMEAQIRASAIGQLANSVRTIHNPLSLDVFSPPADRVDARQTLGITNPAPIIAFGAYGTQDPRKGLPHLIQALIQVKASNTPFQLLVFGASPPQELADAGIPCLCVGHVSDQARLRMVYGVADLYALPSLEDNSPQTGIEAMACGTPVVAFNSGGIVDYVKPGLSGFLAQTGNTSELALRIQEALSDLPHLQAMRTSAREVAVKLFEPNQQAQKYLALYKEALL